MRSSVASKIHHSILFVTAKPSVLAVDNFEAVIDTDPEGNNTLYPIGKLMEVMQHKNNEEKPFYDEFQVG